MTITVTKEIDFTELINLNEIIALINDMIMDNSEWEIEETLKENEILHKEVIAEAIKYVKKNL